MLLCTPCVSKTMTLTLPVYGQVSDTSSVILDYGSLRISIFFKVDDLSGSSQSHFGMNEQCVCVLRSLDQIASQILTCVLLSVNVSQLWVPYQCQPVSQILLNESLGSILKSILLLWRSPALLPYCRELWRISGKATQVSFHFTRQPTCRQALYSDNTIRNG